MDNDLFSQGIELMLVGMGTVFVFLTALVLATSLMSAIVIRRFPEPTAGEKGPTDEEIAAITAAIRQHRRQ